MDCDEARVEQVLHRLKKMAEPGPREERVDLYERAMQQLERKRKRIEEAQVASLVRQEEEQAGLTFRPTVNKTKKSRNFQEFLHDQQDWIKRKQLKLSEKRAAETQREQRQMSEHQAHNSSRQSILQSRRPPRKGKENMPPGRQLSDLSKVSSRPSARGLDSERLSQKRLRVMLGQLP